MRTTLTGAFSLVCSLLLAVAAIAGGGESTRSLEDELSELMNEILETEAGGENPFESGAVPHLAVLATSNVVGEVTPCG